MSKQAHKSGNDHKDHVVCDAAFGMAWSGPMLPDPRNLIGQLAAASPPAKAPRSGLRGPSTRHGATVAMTTGFHRRTAMAGQPIPAAAHVRVSG